MALKRISGMGLEKFQNKGTTNKIKALEEENSELLFKLALSESKMEFMEDSLAEVLFKIAALESGGM